MFNLKINDVEQKTFNEWYDNHLKTCSKKHKSDSNIIHLRISSSGVGNQFIAICPLCGKEKDITDYDSW